MRLRPLHVACLALVLLGLAGTVYKVHFPPGPMADEAAYALMAESLWHDRDLQFDRRDLERAYNLWDQGPHGIILFTRDGGETMFFGKPFVYSAVALPLVLLFGTQGFLVLNMALYLAMLAAAWVLFHRRREEMDAPALPEEGGGRAAAGARPAGPHLGNGAAGLFLAGFFFASAAFVYVFWIHPEVFNMACVFFPLAAWAWLRGRPRWGRWEYLALVVAGGLLAAAFVSKEPLAVMALPLGVDLVWSRRWRGLAAVVAGGLLGLALLVGIQYRLTGAVSPYRGVQRSSFETNYPFEMQGDPWAAYKGTSYGSWSGLTPEATPRTVLYDTLYFFVGRHTGLVPYFPFAVFALGLYLWACWRGPRDRFAHLVALAVLAYCAFFLLMRPWNYQGGAGFLGNRYFAGIYPVLLLLITRFDARRSLLLPFAAAGLWTAAVVAVPLQQITPEATLQSHVRTATFQALPLELTLLSGGSIPGYALRNWGQGVWVLPKQNFFHAERHPNGIWVRGASRSEVVVVSPVPLRTIHFTAYSPLPDNVLTVESGVARVAVPFSEEENRDGVVVELPVEPVARDLGFLQGARREYFYRFTLSTTDGWMPARVEPDSPDYRYLSAFLSFTGDPP
ncbi:MAG TPA: hypothetical protein VHQ65_12400 [Thermoanaerobaculia bacterium]|nr:hypothetical protein [Thermoanaerobaculia bacterium]